MSPVRVSVSPAVQRLVSFVRRGLGNREAMTVASFSALTILGGLVGNRFLTEVASPKALGDLYLYMTFVLWATVPTQAAFVYLLRHWPLALESGQTRWFGRRVGMASAMQAVIGVLVLLLFRTFTHDLDDWRVMSWLWLACIGYSVGQGFEPAQNSARRRATAGLINFIGVPFRAFAIAAGALILRVSTGVELVSLQAIHYTCYAAAAFIAYLALARRRSPASDDTPPELSTRSFFAHWTPYLIGTITVQGCVSAERWGLARLVDSGSTAVFVQATGLAMAIGTAATSFINNYFFPIIFQRAIEPSPIQNARAHIRKFLVLTAVALVGSVGAIALLAPWLTRALFGHRFYGVSSVLPWAMLGAGLTWMGEGFGIFSYAARETLVTNGAKIVSQLSYIAILVVYRPASDPARGFARVFAARGALYAVLMLAIGIWLVRREQSRLRAALAEPAAANPS